MYGQVDLSSLNLFWYGQSKLSIAVLNQVKYFVVTHLCNNASQTNSAGVSQRQVSGIYGAFHAIGIGSVIKLGQKEPRPIQNFTVRATLTRSVETKIGLSQRKKSFDPIPTRDWNTA